MTDSIWYNAEKRGEAAVKMLRDRLGIPSSKIEVNLNFSK
jgi:hypothetical protein